MREIVGIGELQRAAQAEARRQAEQAERILLAAARAMTASELLDAMGVKADSRVLAGYLAERPNLVRFGHPRKARKWVHANWAPVLGVGSPRSSEQGSAA